VSSACAAYGAGDRLPHGAVGDDRTRMHAQEKPRRVASVAITMREQEQSWPPTRASLEVHAKEWRELREASDIAIGAGVRGEAAATG
jgi:hypothetical protein